MRHTHILCLFCVPLEILRCLGLKSFWKRSQEANTKRISPLFLLRKSLAFPCIYVAQRGTLTQNIDNFMYCWLVNASWVIKILFIFDNSKRQIMTLYFLMANNDLPDLDIYSYLHNNKVWTSNIRNLERILKKCWPDFMNAPIL